MRRPTLNNLITLLAITQTATAFALPKHEGTTSASAEDYNIVEKRANAQLTVPILSSTALETWQGTKQYLGMFGTGLTDNEIRASAKQTYESLTGRLPATLLVSVIFVPRGGLAAGTIWRAGDQQFEATARATAPAFWEAVPGDQQQVLPNMRNEHKWHSEAVATRQAEVQYKHLSQGAIGTVYRVLMFVRDIGYAYSEHI
jgi:hypothetical protein